VAENISQEFVIWICYGNTFGILVPIVHTARGETDRYDSNNPDSELVPSMGTHVCL
jgi:hypothetical protein